VSAGGEPGFPGTDDPALGQRAAALAELARASARPMTPLQRMAGLRQVTARLASRRLRRLGAIAAVTFGVAATAAAALVLSGRLDLGGGRTTGSATPTDRAASLLGGLLASQLQKTLSGRLPFDVLTIESEQGLASTRLEAGTYLTDDVYVGYVGHLGADPARLQNRNAVRLEYQLSRRWSFQGEYGDAKTGSADVIWKKHY